MNKNINASCCSGVILEQRSLILRNLLSFPKLKSASISILRRDRRASNSVITSVSTVLTTIFLKAVKDNVSSGK